VELLDLVVEIERYAITKGINKNSITVAELIDMMNEDGLEEL
jgi:hypothetical protein